MILNLRFKFENNLETPGSVAVWNKFLNQQRLTAHDRSRYPWFASILLRPCPNYPASASLERRTNVGEPLAQ